MPPSVRIPVSVQPPMIAMDREPAKALTEEDVGTSAFIVRLNENTNGGQTAEEESPRTGLLIWGATLEAYSTARQTLLLQTGNASPRFLLS